MTYTHIRNDDETGALARDLADSNRFALDCEAAGFHRYSDRLCLVQISTPRATYVLDPLAFDPRELLLQPLGDPGIEVVMHGADYDLRLLSRDLGVQVRGLFDTQIAAALLGIEGLGLSALLMERFGIELSKKYQRADWAKRPLTEEMLAYATDDTRHLLALANQLSTELRRADRAEWAAQECRRLEGVAFASRQNAEPPDPVARVKGARDLQPREVHALRVALEWRDEVARERDRAPFRVVGDGPLVKAVAMMPRRAAELASIKGFPGDLARRDGPGLIRRLGAVAKLEERLIVPYPTIQTSGSEYLPPEVEERIVRLKTVRNQLAGELGLARGTLLSNTVIAEIARKAPNSRQELAEVDGVRAWQVGATGDELLAAIDRADRPD